MEITLEKIMKLFEKGTATVLHNGKIYFTKEKAVRQQPNDFKVLKNNYELIIPRFFK